MQTGDVNCDGSVNVSDITTLINHILGNEPTPFIKEKADIDENNTLDVSDAVALLNIILQGTAGLVE